jgi:tRNA(Ile)-lysidine synthase
VEVLVKDFDTEKYAQENKKGIQEAARDLRYAWFAEIVNRESSIVSQQSLPQGGSNRQKEDKSRIPGLTSHVLTAHHADDNIETVMMNFFRGTGLHGLEGIPLIHQYIRRPLLPFWKEELIRFAKENKLEFVEDSSNQSIKYTRNFFRNEIIPLISKVYPEVKTNLQDNINRFGEIKNFIKFLSTRSKGNSARSDLMRFIYLLNSSCRIRTRALIFEIISEHGFTERQVDEVIKLAEAASGKFIQSPTSSHRIINSGIGLLSRRINRRMQKR